MSQRLYYSDSYLAEFTASVVETRSAPGGRYHVIVDGTAFYPESGGQPADRGELGGRPVLDVQESGDGEVLHVMEAAIAPGPGIVGKIDRVRRFDHMQQHTGQHLLSAVCHERFKLKTVGFHLGPDLSTVDLDADRMEDSRLREIVDGVNAIIWDNRPVTARFYPKEEAEALGLRKPTAREGEIRVVEVEGCDRSACGGTHVCRTGEVGVLLALRTEKMKGKTRVHFVCGRRALRVFWEEHAVLSSLSALTTCGFVEMPGRVGKLMDDVRSLAKERSALKSELLGLRVPDMLASGRLPCGGSAVVAALEEDGATVQGLCRKLMGSEGRVGLAVLSVPDMLLFAGRSVSASLDASSLIGLLKGRFGVKGGGRADFAQAGNLPSERLGEILEACGEWLRAELSTQA